MPSCNCLSSSCRAVWFWSAAIVTVLFVGFYIILLKMVWGQALDEYLNSINRIGFWIHVPTGIAYFLCGFLQFSESLRRSLPKVHRCIGYTYYALALITSVGIFLICLGGAMARESMVLATALGWPLWMYWTYQSFVAICMGDVPRHRNLNWRAFLFSLTVISMRFVTVAVVNVCRLTVGESLKSAVWFSWVSSIVIAEVYLWYESESEPCALVLPSGKVVAHSVYPNVLPVPWLQATIVSLQHLNARTLMVVLRLDNADSLKIPLLLGQHISLRVRSKGQTMNRSYSIVNDAAQLEEGRIHLIVRLVPDGVLSTALTELAASLQSETVSTPTEKFEVAFAQPTLTFAPNAHRCVILLAAGTGITPFFNVIRAILDNPRDTSHVVLMWVNSSAADMFSQDQLALWARSSRFRAQTHLTKSNGTRFDQQCLRTLLSSAADLTSVDTASSRVMICGPREFVRDMDKGCRELGLDSCNVVSFGHSDC